MFQQMASMPQTPHLLNSTNGSEDNSQITRRSSNNDLDGRRATGNLTERRGVGGEAAVTAATGPQLLWGWQRAQWSELPSGEHIQTFNKSGPGWDRTWANLPRAQGIRKCGVYSPQTGEK